MKHVASPRHLHVWENWDEKFQKCILCSAHRYHPAYLKKQHDTHFTEWKEQRKENKNV